ncbi:MAG: CIA30 family protein [Woeseiaceae bacterium]
MPLVVAALVMSMGASVFSMPSTELDWIVVNDNVMGGRSQGGFSVDDDVIIFEGKTNTNGGGFSSIRTGMAALDLSHSAGITLRVKGDGRRYTWQLSSGARWRGYEVSFWQDFDTVDGEWQTVRLAFAGFIPKIRGSRLKGPGVDASRISGMGLMIYDNLDGPFSITLGEIGAYEAEED